MFKKRIEQLLKVTNRSSYIYIRSFTFFTYLFFFIIIVNFETFIGKIRIDSSYYRNYNNSQFFLPINPLPFNKCKKCNFTPYQKSTPNSSKKDAILTIGTNKLFNLMLFIRTLRTTGSQSRFILFTNNQVFKNYNNEFFRVINDCGVEIINIGTTPPNFCTSHIRFMIFKDFLIKNRNLIDRVFLCDLYDTVVQHDPFITDFGNSLYFNDEGFKISESPVNSFWINDGFKFWRKEYDPLLNFDKKLRKKIFDQKILNSGIQAGTTDAIIQFCSIMCSAINKKKFQPYFLHDQAFQNMVVYSGYLDKRINYTILSTSTDLFASIDLISRKIDNSSIEVIFGRIQRDGGIPGILHQYDRSKKIRSLLSKICPNEDKFPDYIRYR